MSNPFQLFGLKPKYNLDQKELDRVYFKLQFDQHPDKNNVDTTLSSSSLNMAYQSLKNPVKRAAAMLSAFNLSVPGQGSDAVEGENILLDIFEFQEAIMLCESKGRALEIKDDLDEMFVEEQEFFALSCDKNNIEELPESYVKLSYIDKLRRQINEVEQRFYQKTERMH